MKHFYLFILLLVFGLSSCNQLDYKSISSAEDRIIGTWKMERVRNQIKKDGKWGKNDVSLNFKDWTFTFNKDYSASVIVPAEDLSLEGYWEIYETYDYDDEGNETTEINLYIYVYNPDNIDEFREFIWEDMRVSSRKFEAQESRFINGEMHRYFYELSK